jgi:hypothetical protein
MQHQLPQGGVDQGELAADVFGGDDRAIFGPVLRAFERLAAAPFEVRQHQRCDGRQKGRRGGEND